jgi:putative ATP-dependent endonuclease of OLD family
MNLRRVHIQNFRGIKNLELDLDNLVVLIGENNTGKTAILHAIRLCLRDMGPRRRVVFDAFDFHLKDENAEPSSADPISITITFAEDTVGDWDSARKRRLKDILHVVDPDSGRSSVVLRVTCSYNLTERDFDQTWDFLNEAGQPLPSKSEAQLGVLQREVAFFLLDALRDAGRNFDAKGPFWRPFLKDSQLQPDKKAEIEAKLKEVNDLVVTSHGSFEQARDRLKKVQEVVPMQAGDVVSIEAVPGRMFDMLTKAQVHLGTTTGAKVPVGRHGEGTQSLAVLMLFAAFLDLDAAGGGKNRAPVVALEEPEAHLHPSAVRTLWKTIEGVPGQKLISTHSGDLLSEVDVDHVRRIARVGAEVRAFRVRTQQSVPPAVFNALPPAEKQRWLSTEEARKFNYHVRRARGELLFAQCWLLVEGETEAWIFPAAARAMRIDLHRAGVRVVEYSQTDVGLLAKVANELGIPWLCVVDDDSGRAKYEPAVLSKLDGAPASDRLCLPYANVEIHLLSNGYDGEYAPLMPAQNLARVTRSAGDPRYWEEYAAHLPNKAKTRGAAAVAMEMEARGSSGVTAELQAVLNKVVTLAGGL